MSRSSNSSHSIRFPHKTLYLSVAHMPNALPKSSLLILSPWGGPLIMKLLIMQFLHTLHKYLQKVRCKQKGAHKHPIKVQWPLNIVFKFTCNMPNKMNILRQLKCGSLSPFASLQVELEPYLVVQWTIVNVKASVQTAANIYYWQLQFFNMHITIR